MEKQSVEVSDEEIQKVVDEEREKNARVIDVWMTGLWKTAIW